MGSWPTRMGPSIAKCRSRLTWSGRSSTLPSLTAEREPLLAARTMRLQNGSHEYPSKVLPHFKTTFCLDGSVTSTNGYLRMDQLNVIK